MDGFRNKMLRLSLNNNFAFLQNDVTRIVFAGDSISFSVQWIIKFVNNDQIVFTFIVTHKLANLIHANENPFHRCTQLQIIKIVLSFTLNTRSFQNEKESNKTWKFNNNKNRAKHSSCLSFSMANFCLCNTITMPYYY